ncbi:MAG: diadenylate cyclase CdaA [Culicoidibacterales bacterium]
MLAFLEGPLWQTIRISLDIIIVWAIFYGIIHLMKVNVRMIQIFKGVAIIIILKIVSSLLQLNTVEYLMNQFIQWGVLVIFIIFQPEIRGALEQLGRKSSFGVQQLGETQTMNLIDQLVQASEYMAKRRIGALMTIQRQTSLQEFSVQATSVDALVTAPLLTTIFTPSTALHDGAIIIQENRIVAAGAIYPTTKQEGLPAEMGTRHRAALGISEISDSITIVVSEETGEMSIARYGFIEKGLTAEQLKAKLLQQFEIQPISEVR